MSGNWHLSVIFIPAWTFKVDSENSLFNYLTKHMYTLTWEFRTYTTGRERVLYLQELHLLDETFIQDVYNKLTNNALSRKSLEQLVVEHMRRTSVIRVQAITVGPAPLTRTRSLNDAVDGYRSQNSSASSTTSRRSEPDFRRYTVSSSPEYEDLWGSNDKLNNNNRVVSPAQ